MGGLGPHFVRCDGGGAAWTGHHRSLHDGADIDELKVKTIYVEQGTTLKRFTARAKGRGNRISKPTCHIYVTVGN